MVYSSGKRAQVRRAPNSYPSSSARVHSFLALPHLVTNILLLPTPPLPVKLLLFGTRVRRFYFCRHTAAGESHAQPPPVDARVSRRTHRDTDRGHHAGPHLEVADTADPPTAYD